MSTDLASVNTAFDKREFINFLRGLAVFLMLWGHSVQYCTGGQFDFFENIVFKIIYSFHMPFFMLISGYLFFFSEQKRGMFELIEYKGKSLLYPILMCSLLNLLLTQGVFVVSGGGYPALIGAIPINSLWFIWSVLACSIALALAMKLSSNLFIQGLLVVICIPFAALFPNWDMNVWMYPYFVIGYLYARNEEWLRKYRSIIGIASSLIYIIMLFFFEKKHYIYTTSLLGGETRLESIAIDFFRWAIGLFGSVAVVWLCGFMYARIRKGKVGAVIEKLGKHSLAVYALSVSLLSFWLPRFANKCLSVLPWLNWNKYIWVYNVILTPLVAVAYSLLFLWIIKGLKKIGAYRLIFGR